MNFAHTRWSATPGALLFTRAGGILLSLFKNIYLNKIVAGWFYRLEWAFESFSHYCFSCMNADLTLFRCLYGYNGPGIPTEGRGWHKRKWGKEAKLITITQFPPQHTMIMYLIAQLIRNYPLFFTEYDIKNTFSGTPPM